MALDLSATGFRNASKTDKGDGMAFNTVFAGDGIAYLAGFFISRPLALMLALYFLHDNQFFLLIMLDGKGCGVFCLHAFCGLHHGKLNILWVVVITANNQ